MPALPSNNPTLLDVAALPGNEGIAQIVNMLAQFNPMLMDAPAFECNKGEQHETTVLTGLPTNVWGRLYKGIPTSKGTRQMIKDTTGFLEGAAEVDERLVDIHEKAMEKASIRLVEASSHLEAMSQEVATALFYHDTAVDPERPMGFAPRFSSLSAENGGQIIDAGGTGTDNSSMWFITWDRTTNHLIYPKTHRGGIQRIDRGKVPVLDGNGDTYFVYREEFVQHVGLTVRDWRYVARIANIDISDLVVDAATGAHLFDLMTEAYYKHYGRRVSKGTTYIYANTTIVKFLDYHARKADSATLFLTYGQGSFGAKEVLMYRGIEIRESDALTETEARVI